jgi:hypothetical protein
LQGIGGVAVKIDESLQRSFRAALVLTGSVEGAERAVTDAIAAASDLSADTLLLETARESLQHSTHSDGLPSCLPPELQAIFRLDPTRRHCFILRVLVGFDVQTCSEILNLSRGEIEEAIYESLLDLPRRVDCQKELINGEH